MICTVEWGKIKNKLLLAVAGILRSAFLLCYVIFCFTIIFFAGGGWWGGHVTFPCVTIIRRSPWKFFHNSDNNSSFVKLQFSPFGTILNCHIVVVQGWNAAGVIPVLILWLRHHARGQSDGEGNSEPSNSRIGQMPKASPYKSDISSLGRYS